MRLRVAPNTKSAVLGFDEVFADPYDGHVLGQRQWGAPRLDRTPAAVRLQVASHPVSAGQMGRVAARRRGTDLAARLPDRGCIW